MRHKRMIVVVSACLLAVASAIVAGPAAARPLPAPGSGRLEVYTGQVQGDDLAAIFDLGVDRQDVQVTADPAAPGTLDVEVILGPTQVEQLARQGIVLTPKTINGVTATDQATAEGQRGRTVFRRYEGKGGLKAELERLATKHAELAELQVIGQTVNGVDIVAMKVTKDPGATEDGSKPTAVYIGAQHAREWITPEMVRRLLIHVLDRYGKDQAITDLVDATELWFVPVANPDGYDFTFEEGQRLWRKNLRDNDGDGQITPEDGVDLNRNLATRWGYDNEGSSPQPSSETYRGPSAGSEPETQALDDLFARLTPQFLVNYHSAAELLLHGVGWQVATPSPDDVIYEAMLGDDAEPAVPGYDPDISAELYTTNGETDTHVQEAYGSLSITPEMSTCETASAVDPNDRWAPEDCGSVFEFPDDEKLVRQEVEKNFPLALAVAASAAHPDEPVSVVGREAEDFRVDSFSVSYGDPQTVAVWAKRALTDVTLHYSVDGGTEATAPVDEWAGGERYGAEINDYYAELRGEISGVAVGSTVEVWFTGKRTDASDVESERFSYTLQQDSGNSTLVIANEDYTGVNPDYPPDVTVPKYLEDHLAALAANGVTADTWDVDAQGVPHDLGVLSHYDTVVWYLGDNRLTQDPEDELTDIGGDQVPDQSVAERQQYLTLAVRDFLNESGKLLLAGETTAYYGTLAGTIGGIYYGLDGAPEEDCVVTVDLFSDCLLLADDFTQYYLGAYGRTPLDVTSGVSGLDQGPLAGIQATFGGDAVADNPVDEAGTFRVTSDVLPADEFPQFASAPAAGYLDPVGPFIAVEGDLAAGASHADNSYMRLARTYDLTGVAAADAPRFEAQFSYDTEEGYDHVLVEAHVVGQDDWTTLPEVGGQTSNAVPAECEVGFLLDLHPWLEHYLTRGNPCAPNGSSGAWNSFTGASDGWIPVAFDLSAYAGQQVELVISYVSDPFTGGTGLAVDDTRIVTNAGPRDEDGFEDGIGGWTLLGAPEGSPANVQDFEVSAGLGGITASVTTDDTILLGFGLEQLATDDERTAVVAAALEHLAVPN
jgi:hypothetical protein